VGGFAISAFILSSISFVHTGADARLDGSSRALNLPHFLSLPASLPHSLFRGGFVCDHVPVG
jgi:hypothetical protein